jgi:hypothetical protein
LAGNVAAAKQEKWLDKEKRQEDEEEEEEEEEQASQGRGGGQFRQDKKLQETAPGAEEQRSKAARKR